MCQWCFDAAKKHFPELREDEYGELLINFTCFPFGTPEQVDKQLAELSKKRKKKKLSDNDGERE